MFTIEDPTVEVKCRFGYRDVKKHYIQLLHTYTVKSVHVVTSIRDVAQIDIPTYVWGSFIDSF